MLIFKDPLEKSEQYLEKKVGKDRLRCLEKTLRILGNFQEKDIEIEEGEYQEKEQRVLYEVKDLDNTSFKFYNFTTEPKACDKNYNLKMRRENSILTFTYEFWGLCPKIIVTEIQAPLSPSRTMSFKNIGSADRLTITEDEKQYVLVLNRKKEDEIICLLEHIITSLSEIETLNLESILEKLGMNQNLFTILIFINDIQRGYCSFKKGKLVAYTITDEEKLISGKFGENISRAVVKHRQEETLPKKLDIQTAEQIKSDIKVLFKNL